LYLWYVRLIGLAACLALVVIVLGAWVRLTDAGLGCPDWPGCYGSLIVPDDTDPDAVAAANARFERPLESDKGWHEMIHRYAASTLGFSILLAALLAWLNRRDPNQPVKMPLVLLGVVIFQGQLGMWTVTLLLKPIIVMGHLLGGLTTLGMAAWLLMDHLRRQDRAALGHPRAAFLPAVIGLVLLVFQIALGGWTSSNYAALACPDLPTCNGAWWPEHADFAEGFVMWRGLGVDYEFGVLEAPARVAIHWTHRIGAVIASLWLGSIGWRAWRKSRNQTINTAGVLVLTALAAQVSIGLGVVWLGLPLWLATAHNGVAALLLLATINLNHAAATYPKTAQG